MSTTPTSAKTFIEKETGCEFPLPPTDLPFDDEEILESNRHRIGMNTLIHSVEEFFADRNDFFTGGNMFIYYSSTQAKNQDFKGPDFFVVLNIDGSYAREAWFVWEEGGRYPDVIVELMSSSTKEKDLGTKKDIYERVFRTPDYFVFDPFDPNSLQGWHLNGSQRYQPLEFNDRGWLWCQTLGLWLGTWEGTIDRHQSIWLRFYNPEGELVLLPAEAAQQQANQAQQRVEEMEAMLAKYRERFGELSE